uniref:FRA10A associated CGG repeat 1 n=1 Tax=Catharus ustulatus TaxID=91951 RepID=A0A8C3VCL2_CATUS
MVFIFSLKEIVDDVLLKKPFQKAKQGSVVHRQFAAEECDREEARKRRFHLISMDAYERHKKFVHDYILYYGGKIEDFRRSGANDKTDLDIIRENHRFLWNEEDEADMNWEKRLAKKYYDKLFKEYCIADLSRYKENKFGFRWRHEKEVISGKGQFSCGNKHCDENEGLKSWEVNFGYVEHGEKRNALVKLSKSAPSRRCTLKRRQVSCTLNGIDAANIRGRLIHEQYSKSCQHGSESPRQPQAKLEPGRPRLRWESLAEAGPAVWGAGGRA